MQIRLPHFNIDFAETLSVTGFREKSPIWQYFASLWAISKSLNSIWQNFIPSLLNCYAFWATFHCYKWPNIEKLSSHPVTLETLSLVSA